MTPYPILIQFSAPGVDPANYLKRKTPQNEKPRKTKNPAKRLVLRGFFSGRHGTRTRNPLRGNSVPMSTLTIRLPSNCDFHQLAQKS